jgi:antitoxin FitA
LYAQIGEGLSSRRYHNDSMAQILIRNLDDNVVAKLKKRAGLHGRSLEAEVRLLLTNSVQFDINAIRELRKSLGTTFDDSTKLIREDRER